MPELLTFQNPGLPERVHRGIEGPVFHATYSALLFELCCDLLLFLACFDVV
jgi:hypothetical protein